jgi:tRNA1Val (adenine37-N6)-methyltransferase
MPRRKSCFEFKQFTIHQDQCAMKVGTDGILLGAWADLRHSQRVLDIGTGTGLIALMVAQRSPSSIIDAVEIDRNAYLQAVDNVRRSPWSERIQVYHGSIQELVSSLSQANSLSYDLVISNPPFFANASKSPQLSRNLARHSDRLSVTELLQIAAQLLKPQGSLAVIYPWDMAQNLIAKASTFNLFSDRQLLIKPTSDRAIKRVLIQFIKSTTAQPSLANPRISTLVIEVAKHLYSPEFIALTQDFYL